MMVKSWEILQGDRWWYIKIVCLDGDVRRISSFVSYDSALNYIKLEGITPCK
jgi:hypothetical protein